MASKFVRSVKDIYNLQQFNTNLVDENDILSTINGDVYIYTKHGFLRLEDLKPIKDAMKELEEQEKQDQQTLKQHESLINTNKTNIDTNKTSIESNKKDIEVIQTSVSDNKAQIDTIKQKVDTINVDEINKKIDDLDINALREQVKAINVDEINKSIQDVKQVADKNTSDLATTNQNVSNNTDGIQKVNVKVDKNTRSIMDLNPTDTGWKDITLTGDGITNYSDTPQYRITSIKGVQTIALRGSVKGLKSKNITIAKLPLDSDLTNPHYFVQNSSLKSGNVQFNRWTVQRDGSIVFEGSTNSAMDGTEWNPINTIWNN